MSVGIEDAPGERRAGDAVAACRVTSCVGIELRLYRLEQRGVDDRRVKAIVNLVLVHDQPEIDAVAQQLEQRAATEGLAADGPAGARRSLLGANTARVEPALQRMHRAQLEIGVEDRANRSGFGLVDDERTRALGGEVVAERHVATHPHALRLGGGDLVADALAGDLALELCEGQQHVERQPAHAGGGVEGLGDADEGDVLPVEQLDHAGKIGERPGQPIDLVDDHDIDLAGFDVGEQAPERRPVHRPAGIAAIVIGCSERAPAFALLALHIGFAGLALGIQAVERLVEAFLRALARIERAAFALASLSWLTQAEEARPVPSRAGDRGRCGRQARIEPSPASGTQTSSTSTSTMRPCHSRRRRAPTPRASPSGSSAPRALQPAARLAIEPAERLGLNAPGQHQPQELDRTQRRRGAIARAPCGAQPLEVEASEGLDRPRDRFAHRACLALVATDALDLLGGDDQPAPLERPGERAAHRVRLPAGGGHHLGNAGALAPRQQRGELVELASSGGLRALRGVCLRALRAFAVFDPVVMSVSSLARRQGRRRYREEPGGRAQTH